jgi:hypothetical protein
VNCQQILNLLMQRLGNRTEADLRASCVLEMILAQQTKLENGAITPWFLAKDSSGLVTAASQRSVTVPTDFIREFQEMPLYLVDSSGTRQKLLKKSWEELVDIYGLEATGQPLQYALVGGAFQMFPLPLQVYSLELKYAAKQGDVADDAGSENTWCKWAPDLVIAVTGEVVAAQYLQNMEMAGGFAAMEAVALRRLDTAEVARDEANRERAMG